MELLQQDKSIINIPPDVPDQHIEKSTPSHDEEGQSSPAQSTPEFSYRNHRFTANPAHTRVTRDPASTTGYFRMLLAAMPVRYAIRSVLDSMHAWDSPKFLEKSTEKPWSVVEEGIKNPADEGKKSDAVRTLSRNGLVFGAEKNFEEGIEHFANTNNPKEYGGYKKGIKTRIKKNLLDTHYDRGLGLGSLFVTASYEKRVYDDIKDIYSECVAYEKGDTPGRVTFSDMWGSSNKIVSSTIDNFMSKTLLRLGTDLMFFGRELSRVHPALRLLNSFRFGDAMIGVKGGLLMYEVLKKDSTLFIDLMGLIDNKINPERGLGASITSADIIDLYQKYCHLHNPDAAFQDTTIYQKRDGMSWPKSEAMFLRIADLMNQTYLYKHSSLDDLNYEESSKISPADFALPKLIYLLGHDMIDSRKPEQSYALVEIAGNSSLGIEAVKEASKMFARGKQPIEVAKYFGVDISPVMDEKSAHETVLKSNKNLKNPFDVPDSSLVAKNITHNSNSLLDRINISPA